MRVSAVPAAFSERGRCRRLLLLRLPADLAGEPHEE